MRNGPRAQLERMSNVERSVVAERIRVEMARRRMTQQQLADRLGYTQTAISYWCSGARRPSIDDLCRLADEFKVTTDYLLGRAASRDEQQQ